MNPHADQPNTVGQEILPFDEAGEARYPRHINDVSDDASISSDDECM